MTMPTADALLQENEDLRRRLEEAEETLRALRAGEADAILVDADVERVFTLESVDKAYWLLVRQIPYAAATLTSEAAEKHAEQVGLIDHAQKSHWLALRKRWLATSQADFEQAAVRDTSGDLVSVEE